jgi:hypothetical protein
MNRRPAILSAILLAGAGAATPAQVTYTNTTIADAFLATGSPENPDGADLTDLNFGAAGTLVIAPATSVKGEFRSVIQFHIPDAMSLFNATYGSNHWSISGICLELVSNYGTEGVQPNNPIFNVIGNGNFVIEWISTNNWPEGTGTPNLPTTDGVTYSWLPSFLSAPHEVLCTNTYVAPGDNVHVTWPLPLRTNLIADVFKGDVSFYFYAADDQINYLFNSHSYGRGNEPLIEVTAIPLLRILSGYFTNGLFHLVGIGGTNALYQVQASPNLSTNWQTIGTATADNAGAIQFDDAGASNHPLRFYRFTQ